MTGPNIIGVGVQALVENAKRLGLTWGLRPATVFNADPLTAFYDGDTSAIGMVSLIGPLVPGARVMAMAVPPAGIFIIGTPPTPGLLPVRHTEQANSTGQTNTAYAAVANGAAQLTFTAPPSGRGLIITRANFSVNTTASVSRQVFCSPRLGLDAVIGAGTAQSIFDVTTPNDQLSMDIVTRGTLTESGPGRNLSATYFKDELTPDAPYNIQLQFRISSAVTANYDVFYQVVAWIPYQ